MKNIFLAAGLAGLVLALWAPFTYLMNKDKYVFEVNNYSLTMGFLVSTLTSIVINGIYNYKGIIVSFFVQFCVYVIIFLITGTSFYLNVEYKDVMDKLNFANVIRSSKVKETYKDGVDLITEEKSKIEIYGFEGDKQTRISIKSGLDFNKTKKLREELKPYLLELDNRKFKSNRQLAIIICSAVFLLYIWFYKE
ncbi:hypothetical protein [Helicovermis profundi]|uniref:Uncharacterized protein n=1 Tax=Helicovermis profundi TaxID=3065157 RepID=A0AAU9E801_9FIRM|nr:hypothetical protein HLPR_18940 [Clostridia bacterium S502]